MIATRRRPRRRLSAGHLVMIGAGLVGIVLTLALVRQADQREDIALAASALTPGTVFDGDDVRWTRARIDGDVPAVRRGDLDRLVGMIVTRRVAEGDILSPNDLRPAAATEDLRAVSIPIPRSRAVNGALAPGDRIDVIHASGDDVRIVVADAEVLDVHDDSGGALGGGLSEFAITVAVTAAESQLLTAAVTDGNVLLARSTGATSAAEEPPLSVRRAQD